MPDTTAKIRAKGCDATGITEELAEKLFAHKGKHLMAIVELKVDEIHDKTDGKQRVDLVITQVEPADDSTTDGKMLEDHLRELTRTTYYNRKVDDAQPTLPDAGGPDPKIGDVIARGNALTMTEEEIAALEAQERAEADDDVDEDQDDDGPAYDDTTEAERDVDDTELPTGEDWGDKPEPTNVVQFGFGDQAEVTDPHTYVDTASALCAVCQHPAGHHLHQAASA